MNRRQFIQNAGLAVLGTTVLPSLLAANPKGVNWPIGCFNRPWINSGLDYDATLDGIKAAGYQLTGLLTPDKKEPLIGSAATPEHIDDLKRKLAAHGLRANIGAVRPRTELAVAECIADLRKQIDNAKRLDLEFLLTFGVDKPAQYETYYDAMRDAAAYVQDLGLKLVLKPHGGGSGAAEEILRCMNMVKHPNFKVWYDAGNIIYYTGKDPLEQLKPIVQHVTGFCAKDCDRVAGEVWLEFGKGSVNFRAVFRALKRAGFNGPVMVECCGTSKTSSAAEVTAAMRKNREYLEGLFATL